MLYQAPNVDDLSCPKGSKEIIIDALVSHALRTLEHVSRSFNGICDVSVSELKERLLKDGPELAETVQRNFRSVLTDLLSSPPKLTSPSDVQLLILKIYDELNDELVSSDRPKFRTWETNIPHHVPCAEIEKELSVFAEQFLHQWNSKEILACEFAAWTEFNLNGRIHPLSDSCGRSSRVLAALILGIEQLPYPDFVSRKDIYLHMNQGWEAWYRFYAGGVKSGALKNLK